MSLTFDWKNQSKPVMGHEKDYVHKMHIVFFKILVYEFSFYRVLFEEKTIVHQDFWIHSQESESPEILSHKGRWLFWNARHREWIPMNMMLFFWI